MSAWLGQFCIYVADLESTAAFYEALGLEVQSRTEIPEAFECVVGAPSRIGSRIQLAQPVTPNGPVEMGNAFIKVSLHTTDVDALGDLASAAGIDRAEQVSRAEPGSITLVDPDGYVVDVVHRDPPDGEADTTVWPGPYSVGVSDLDASLAFWQVFGISVRSQNETVVLAGDQGSAIELVVVDGPIDMGTALWKLYVLTDDIAELHQRVVDAGYRSVEPPVRLERWPTTISFIADPDGYLVELVQLHLD